MSDSDFRLAAGLSGRYRIEHLLGSGGMAVVHLAQDLRHDRKVALKVLRPELAAAIGAERFLQEIRTTAGLQHPHILGLLDSGETEGQLWYAMPFVPGESLRERLDRERQLPVEDAVRLATEVAGALDYAHRQGVIHRDIKPENILLHDGAALVADFGIALAATGATQRLTSTGLSIGTPQYMSPEQASGERQLTPRSDVFSLGCVVYEMLMGQPPFTGPTAQAVIAATLASEIPRLTPRRRSVPANVEAAVLKALEKLPADRFSAAEFAKALGDPGFRSGIHPLARSARPGRLVGLAGLALAASLAWLAIRTGRSPAPPDAPLMRFSITLPNYGAWMDDDGSGMALSADGRVLAYTGRDSVGGRRLYLRPMDQTDPVPVADGATGAMPFFSPDGEWLGFIRGGLHRVPLAGGPAEALCPSLGYVHATWLENGSIVFADGGPQGLRECHPTGEVTTLLASDSVTAFNFPHGLPGDRGLVFTVRRGGVDRLAVLDRRTGAWRSLDIVGTSPRFVEPGSLVFAGPNATLHVAPFDLARLSITGPTWVVEDKVGIGATGAALMAVSRTGVLVTASRGLSDQTLELVDRSGRGERLHARVGRFLDPRVSPDGARIAVGLDGEIWVLDRGQETLDRLTSDALASRPVWT
ncbi:MAG TPA: serine/threonine-protein kinase, partial [Gemmatimonadales bacterium]|nr:serine/threonine-protein kinase [Gemmatimonadales bacterium]